MDSTMWFYFLYGGRTWPSLSIMQVKIQGHPLTLTLPADPHKHGQIAAGSQPPCSLYTTLYILQLAGDSNRYVDGSAEDCGNSSALALELPQSCTEPSTCTASSQLRTLSIMSTALNFMVQICNKLSLPQIMTFHLSNAKSFPKAMLLYHL